VALTSLLPSVLAGWQAQTRTINDIVSKDIG